MEYIAVALILLVVLNLGGAFAVSRLKPGFYIYLPGEAAAYKKQAYRNPSWKDGDIKSIDDWGLMHALLSVVAIGWPITVPLAAGISVLAAIIFGLYKAIVWAVKIGTKNVVGSNQSNTEV